MLLSTEYRRYFQNIINDLIVEKKCLNDIFYQREDLYGIKMSIYFIIAKMRKKSKKYTEKNNFAYPILFK